MQARLLDPKKKMKGVENALQVNKLLQRDGLLVMEGERERGRGRGRERERERGGGGSCLLPYNAM